MADRILAFYFVFSKAIVMARSLTSTELLTWRQRSFTPTDLDHNPNLFVLCCTETLSAETVELRGTLFKQRSGFKAALDRFCFAVEAPFLFNFFSQLIRGEQLHF